MEEWAALGVGAAILPLSKITTTAHESFPITDKSGREVTIAFQATWPRPKELAPNLKEFAKHLSTVVPKLIAGAASK